MARLDRCNICDYSEQGGSLASNLSPGENGKVRPRNGEMLCDSCAGAVDQTLFELANPEDEDE